MKKILAFLISFIFISFSPVNSEEKQEVFTIRAATRDIVLTGFTRAVASMPLTSESAGRCVSVSADIGEYIEKSGVFACLDDTFIRLEIDSNRVEQARLLAEVAYFKKEVARHKKLVRRNTSAQAELDSLERSLVSFRHQFKARKVEAKILQERQDRYCIKAPSGWRVITRQIEPGQWVNTGQTVAKLGDFSRLSVPFALNSGEYAALLRQGDALSLDFSEQKKWLQAKIRRISPAFDPQTRKINIELMIEEGLAEMRGGIRAQLTLTLPDRSNALLAPAAAVEKNYDEFKLIRADGEEVNIVVLGPGPEGMEKTLRVASPEIKPGDKFFR
ncbi:MAG: efflux RND transporter periplasmic adaptor subunit [Gammaproteobacteria bacterium]|nr:efflux RND transporter periplasmic adaptor subunit [Gammaproteobacteria bacterium]